jgi:hypothetical protein
MSCNGAAAVSKPACAASSAAYLEAGAEQQDPPGSELVSGLGLMFSLKSSSVLDGFGLKWSKIHLHRIAGMLDLAAFLVPYVPMLQ